jgi:hypothetical protein
MYVRDYSPLSSFTPRLTARKKSTTTYEVKALLEKIKKLEAQLELSEASN